MSRLIWSTDLWLWWGIKSLWTALAVLKGTSRRMVSVVKSFIAKLVVDLKREDIKKWLLS
jgi:hypothetical protein